jgi:hypothetical protein
MSFLPIDENPKAWQAHFLLDPPKKYSRPFTTELQPKEQATDGDNGKIL